MSSPSWRVFCSAPSDLMKRRCATTSIALPMQTGSEPFSERDERVRDQFEPGDHHQVDSAAGRWWRRQYCRRPAREISSVRRQHQTFRAVASGAKRACTTTTGASSYSGLEIASTVVIGVKPLTAVGGRGIDSPTCVPQL